MGWSQVSLSSLSLLLCSALEPEYVLEAVTGKESYFFSNKKTNNQGIFLNANLTSSENGSPVESEGVQPNLLPILSLWTQLNS